MPANFISELEEVLDGAAGIADGLRRKVSVFAVLGLLAGGSIAGLLYSSESSLWWNVIKCGFVLLPILTICWVWRLLAGFAAAPKQLAELTSSDAGLLDSTQALSFSKPDSIRGLISTVRAIRNDDNLSGLLESVGSITLLANPLFLMLVFVSVVIALLLILIAPLVLIF